MGSSRWGVGEKLLTEQRFQQMVSEVALRGAGRTRALGQEFRA
jgi:hypothetical protein